MLTLKVIFIDTNKMSLETILSSSFLSEKDLRDLSRFKPIETKKEKAASLILKNRYIKEYNLNEFGKPISEHTFFNISHSHGVVVFVEDSSLVGIDIEKMREVDKKLIDYISSKEEKEYIQNKQNFFEVWTNKESLVKCIGTGIKSKISEIPAFPINGKKVYNGKEYFSKTVIHQDFVISLTREGEQSFEIKVEETTL